MYQWKGEWESAIEQFRIAWKQSEETLEDHVKFSVSLALCHAYLGNAEQATKQLNVLHDVEIDDFTVLYELARAYGLTGKLENAIRCFEDVRELLMDSLTIQHIGGLLEALYELRDADMAESDALQSEILLYDAERDYETDNLEACIRKLQRALEIDSMNPAIYHQLGIGLLRQGRYEEALGMLERGLEFDPMYEEAQFALGDAYFHLGMYECAMNAYKQTLHLNPHNIDAYHHLGLIYEKQGEIEIAKGYWEDVLQVDPTHEDAVRCLANYAD
jgi:tetratricopeptide (TPR) repeat protein